MRPAPRYQTDGYCVPVPVRPSAFQSLKPQHQPCNVEVDLAQLTPFGLAGDHAADELLYADLQINAAVGPGLHLGSGRSGFYRGFYIKGMGRTPLAGNWNVAGGAYHASGHLMPSGAVREYMVSRYLERRGAGAAIVPCEGLLLAPLHPRLRGFAQDAFPGHALSPIDLHLQAISVKDSGFARHANFVWLLNHVKRIGHFGPFFDGLHHHATAHGQPLLAGELDPTSVAAALSRCALQGLEHFAAFLRAGVYWGSFSNNFTLDGRFLDLELPLIFGRPFFGITRTEPDLDGLDLRSSLPVVGCEALEYLLQVRAFVVYVIQRLRFLLDQGIICHHIERHFVAEFVEALRLEFGEDHVVMNRAAACDAVTGALCAALDPGPQAEAALRRIVGEQYGSHFNQEHTDLGGLTFLRLPVDLARIESISRYHAYYPDFLELREDLEEARHLNRALDEIDQLTSIDAVFQAVERLERDIAGFQAPLDS